ncbi:MAG: D-alanyl-D-alanine carboxypeptidase [Clostridia bacterium]|nr:D-alanyl-D-alanine carboxypeptidase [Clostridia bacterium]
MRLFLKICTCCLVLSVLLGGGIGAFAAEWGSTSLLSVSARSAVLMDQYGQVLYAKNADERLPMASTTKIMTALVTLEAMEAGEVPESVKIPAEAVGVEGSSIYLVKGEEMRLTTLLYALMLESANDAAVAIAVAVDGSVEKFAGRMNRKAVELGLDDTRFENPHGLDHETHYTTARDLAMLTVVALENETFAEIVSTVRYSAPVNAEGDSVRLFVNHNRLLREYEGCIGVKTGYTKRCGRCLVSAARRDGITLVAVTLNDPNDWRDHRAMLDYGFSICAPVTAIVAGDLRYTVPVVGGTSASVICDGSDGVTLTLPDGCTPEVRVELPRFLWGEVRAGDLVGRAVVTVNGREAAFVPICAGSDVTAAVYPKSIWQKICDFFAAIGRWLAGWFE